jgi:hypothetical protein
MPEVTIELLHPEVWHAKKINNTDVFTVLRPGLSTNMKEFFVAGETVGVTDYVISPKQIGKCWVIKW